MNQVEFPLNIKKFDKKSDEARVISDVLACRKTAGELAAEAKYIDALERTVEALKTLREFPDFDDIEFRTLLAALLFDLAETYFALKDYKQSEKELDVLFKILDVLIKEDTERFGRYHILAMELSTRILRSRKKALDLLAKQQINTGMLYEKVNSGVVSATDKLVESLRKTAQLLASAGDYKASMKFYAEAIKYSKKRTGRVSIKEVQMTIELAEIMLRVKHMRPRAKRLLDAILPHAITLETVELENEILGLMEIATSDEESEPRWRSFIHKVTAGAARLRAKEKAKSNKQKKEK